MKRFMILAVVMVMTMLCGIIGLIGYQTGKHCTVTETPSDIELVREMVYEEFGDVDYGIVINESKYDGCIDYTVLDDNGKTVMYGYANRENRLEQYYANH